MPILDIIRKEVNTYGNGFFKSNQCVCSPGIQSFDRLFIDLGKIPFSGNALHTCIRKCLGNFFMLTYWVGQPSEKVQKCADLVPLH